jgi:two-component sensor histidine kinase
MVRDEPLALILAPTGRDAEVAVAILHEVALPATTCADLQSMLKALSGAGCAVVTEEALLSSDRRHLAEWISRQPPWSDFPFVLLTYRGGSPDARLPEMLGNVTVLERPFHPAVLANAVKSALRARARQREVEAYQERQALLIAELNHRVKNTLAIVQSVAYQSLRQGVAPEVARERFEARLLSLSKTHGLLNETSWTQAPLQEVLSLELNPYVGDQGQRVVATGPNLGLSAQMAVALGMVFHELTTNAVKYGSLSVPEGRLEVHWTLTDDITRPRALQLRWTEKQGPDVVAPLRTGFGSRLIEQTIQRQLNGAVRVSFEPEGLLCDFEIPLDMHNRSAHAAE